METLKVLTKATAALHKDIGGILTTITERYNIVYKGTDKRVPLEELENLFLPRTCNVVSPNTGNRCRNKCYNGSNYCLKHYSRRFCETGDAGATTSQLQLIQNGSNNLSCSKKEKMFIGDGFYLVDCQYIYDKNTGAKVGYIDDGEFIFTDDPFILESVDTN